MEETNDNIQVLSENAVPFLKEKMEALVADNLGKAKELTSADYNWPTNNPTGIALWKLDAGLYTIPAGTTVHWDAINNAISRKESSAFVFETTRTFNDKGYKNVLWSDVSEGYGDPAIFVYDTSALPSQSGLQNWTNGKILTFGDIKDDLTTNDRTYALSAKQGKVLKDLVDSLAIRGAGAPTTATVGQVGTLYEDTTNGDLYICTDATNPYVWEEVGAGGGGGITELTSADYNWNSTAGDATTEPFDCIALWLLDPGQYTWKDGVKYRLLSTWTASNTYSGNVTVWDAGDSLTGIAADYRGAGRQIRYTNAAGVQTWGNNGLLSTDVYQNGNFSNVRIGYSTTSSGTRTTAIGNSASATATDAIVIGTSAKTSSTSATDAIVIGNSATTGSSGAIAIGKSTKSNTSNGIAIGSNVQSNGIAIGRNIISGGGIAIGNAATANGAASVSIGSYATTSASRGIAIGESTDVTTDALNSVALGAYSKVTQKGEVGIGLGSGSNYGYNDSPYRLLTGLYDGQSAHDAATYGQVISYSAMNGAGAPTTATEGKYVGQLYYDTTNESMYFLKAIDTTTTPATYTWEALGGGSSINVVQTTGSSTTDVMSQKAVSDAITAIGTGTRKATSSGWNTSKPLDYVLQAAAAPSSAQGAMFYTGTNLSDFPVYAGIGVKADETAAVYTPYLLIQTTSDDGQGRTSGNPTAHQIALHSEIPATFTTNEWNALWA